MLFVVVMDVLNNLISMAEASSLLQPLGGPRSVPHHLSLYADDATLFLSPISLDLLTIRAILQVFGEASGLQTNLAKSIVSPIRCSPQQLRLIADELQCPSVDFPCKYLGLPLSLRKPTKTTFNRSWTRSPLVCSDGRPACSHKVV